jgi:hypothetical protein
LLKCLRRKDNLESKEHISFSKTVQYIPESEGDWPWKDPSQIEYFRRMVWELKLLSREMEDGRIQLAKRLGDIRALRDGVSETILFNFHKSFFTNAFPAFQCD